MIADGKVRVMVTLDAGLLGRLDAVAKVERKHRSTVLARAVEHYLEAELRSGTAAGGEAGAPSRREGRAGAGAGFFGWLLSWLPLGGRGRPHPGRALGSPRRRRAP